MRRFGLKAVLLLLAAMACFPPRLGAAPPETPKDGDGWPHRLHIRSDFDGDQVPDIAVVRRHGWQYTLSIDFSGKASRHFQSYYTNVPVIGLRAIDVDGDRDRDIVLLGLNPILPAGLWLNDAGKGFRAASPERATVLQKDLEPGISSIFWGPEADPGSLTEPGPDVALPEQFVLEIPTTETSLSRTSLHFVSCGRIAFVASRAPPLSL